MLKVAPAIVAEPAGNVIGLLVTRSRPPATPALVRVITESNTTLGKPIAAKLEVAAPRLNPITKRPVGNEAMSPFSVAVRWNVDPSKVAENESTSRLPLCDPANVGMKSLAGSAIEPAVAV